MTADEKKSVPVYSATVGMTSAGAITQSAGRSQTARVTLVWWSINNASAHPAFPLVIPSVPFSGLQDVAATTSQKE